MRKFIILLSLFGLLIASCSSDNEGNSSNPANNNGFRVNNVFYPTPDFIVGPITERPDRGFDIYEFYFKNGSQSYIHLDINSPNLSELESMTYPILNVDGREPGISLLRKNGFGFQGINEDYYYNASTNFNDGFIKVSKENGKLIFEYEFNYNDGTKSIRGYAKQP